MNVSLFVHVHSMTNGLSAGDLSLRQNNSHCGKCGRTIYKRSQRLQVEDQVAAGPTVHMKCRVNLSTSFI